MHRLRNFWEKKSACACVRFFYGVQLFPRIFQNDLKNLIFSVIVISFFCSAPLFGEKTEKEEGALDFAELIPEGKEVEGLRLPNFHGDKLSSFIFAKTMERLGRELRLKEMKIEIFDTKGKLESLITIPQARYFMDKNTLVSIGPAQIARKGFVIKGGKLKFDFNTQEVKMTKGVTSMIDL